ncbi:MAG: 6-carboxytetrahydropterin synthase [Hydrogenophaga sp.]|uniref:6-carboxytetrahydropterin synthase n=1 Tax=Hydrogenophaga sp. TaxID=1904254 RepID=UPI00257A280E|nr:6-carboxytetrahydropterin synthase [Hydrogenophaga sp.]MBL0946357.1 6-carboxytetrahydropterin synthase [Hydrogenophaga sp.]
MSIELSQRFFFDAAHTLERAHDSAPSRRVHGHTYHATVAVGPAAPLDAGMVVDLALLRAAIASVRERLDHHLLDEVPGLGRPTLENLCRFVFDHMADPRWTVQWVQVERPASGDACRLGR